MLVYEDNVSNTLVYEGKANMLVYEGNVSDTFDF